MQFASNNSGVRASFHVAASSPDAARYILSLWLRHHCVERSLSPDWTKGTVGVFALIPETALTGNGEYIVDAAIFWDDHDPPDASPPDWITQLLSGACNEVVRFVRLAPPGKVSVMRS